MKNRYQIVHYPDNEQFTIFDNLENFTLTVFYYDSMQEMDLGRARRLAYGVLKLLKTS